MKLDVLHDLNAERTARRAAVLVTDTASGAKGDRPGLRTALEACRAGDTLVVWKLNRPGRSLAHLVETMQSLDKRGVSFRSLQGPLDMTTASGRLSFHMFASLAEFERDLIGERTQQV